MQGGAAVEKNEKSGELPGWVRMVEGAQENNFRYDGDDPTVSYSSS